jgi:hypothetical protein
MKHETARERLPELLRLRPAGPDETELRAHVAGCAECQVLLDSMAAVEQTLHGLGAETPSAALERRVLAIPHAERAKSPRWLRRDKLTAVAASLAVGLAVGLSLMLLRPGASPAGFSAAQTVALRGSDPGVRAHLELGAPQGPNQPLRLTAEGISPSGAAYYTLWLTGPGGQSVSAGTFRPDSDGDCVVIGVVPRNGSWTLAAITKADAPPSSAETVATGKL